MVSLTAIIPTQARDIDRLALLRRSLHSALYQLQDGDEIICVGDTREGSLDDARELCLRANAEAPAGAVVRYFPHDSGRPSWGHDQINHAMTKARGEYLCFQDDDDCFCAGAFGAMREEVAKLPHPAPLLFRFVTHFGLVVWTRRGVVAERHIGGHCAVVPNLPSLLGEWGQRYEGDYDFVRSTVDLWAAVGVEPVFVDRLIAVARPVVRYA